MKTNLYHPRDIFAHAREESEIGSLTNNDIYKFLMLDFILANPDYSSLPVKWEMKIRSKDVRTADVIPQEALIEQLDACKNIKGLTESEVSYLRGLTKPDGSSLFRQKTLDFLKDFILPDYEISQDGSNYKLSFTGPWVSSTMWEIFGLKIMNSLYLYYYTKREKLSGSEFSEIISRALVRLFDDIKTFKSQEDLTFSEFGTRRSMSTDYHRMIYEILSDRLPGQCVGTSNVMLSRELGLNTPKGTNAHELRMIPTALHDDPQKIISTMYDIDRQRGKHFPGFGILLPDTYGTSFYLDNCPDDIIQSHIGCRFDSKDPMISIPEYIKFLEKHGIDPKTKIGIPSDGLTAKSTVEIYSKHKDSLGKLTFGNGTHLTNNTKGLRPRNEEPFGPFGSFSVVIKPTQVQRSDGTRVSSVKLSDNPEKAMGDTQRVELFKTIFGTDGMQKREVLV